MDDLDADGDLDIAATNSPYPGTVSVLLNRTIPWQKGEKSTY